jgi:TonB family protein
MRAKVLIAEERSPVSARLKDLVEKAGFEAAVAYTGQVALAQARAIQPDLLLLSDQIGPPGASETARRLKEDSATQGIPIVILASSAESEAALTRSYPVEASLPSNVASERLAGVIRMLTGGNVRRQRVGPTVGSLEGNLQDSLLPEVLQFLFLSGKTGRVAVSDGARHGSIYFEDGNVLHAEFGDGRGPDAFFQLCFLRKGYFRFEPGIRATSRTMLEGGVELLLDAARQLDTLRRETHSGERESLDAPTPQVDSRGAIPHAGNGASSSMDVGNLPPDPEPVPRTAPELPPRPLSAVERTLSPDPLALAARLSQTHFEPAVTVETAAETLEEEPASPGMGRRVLGAAAAILLLAFALVSGFQLGRFFPLSAPPLAVETRAPLPWEGERFEVAIESNPPGARVVLDGREFGVTPMAKLPLRPGIFVLRLEKEGWEPVQEVLEVRQEDPPPGVLNFNLKPAPHDDLATLVVHVFPAGAAVYIDGKKLPASPTPHRFAPGTFPVRVSARGFETWEGQVQLQAGVTKDLTIQLSRAQGPPPENGVKATEDGEKASAEPTTPPVVTRAQKISGTLPSYPPAAARKKLKGTVQVKIEIDEAGEVNSVSLEQSAGEVLDQAVLSAVKTWKYSPATSDGQPIRSTVTYRHTFQ